MSGAVSVDSILKATVARLMLFGVMALLIMFCSQYFVLSYQSHRAVCEIVDARLNQFIGPLSRELALGNTDLAESIFGKFIERLSLAGASPGLQLTLNGVPTKAASEVCRPSMFGAQVSRPIIFAGKTLGEIKGRVTFFPTIPMILFVVLVVGFLVFAVRVWALGLIGKIQTLLILPIRDLSKGVEIADSAKLPIEVLEVSRNIRHLKMKLVEEEHRVAQLAREKQMSDLAVQVAHDIRSPLAIFGMMDREDFIFNDNNQNLIAAAAKRINDIAQSLINKYRVKGLEPEASGPALVSFVAENILAEKRVSACPKGISVNLNIAADARKAFIKTSTTELGRGLSNLIDNSIEAFESADTRECVVNIGIEKCEGKIVISVSDNGRGIAPEMLTTLAQRGTTSKPNGLGFGLSQARDLSETAGGRLIIESTLSVGTTVKMFVPEIPPPAWFADEFSVESLGSVVLIDDDPAIHKFWQMNLGERLIYEAYSGEDPGLKNLAQNSSCFFIVDFQLGSNRQNGIEIIKSLSLSGRSLLVTSRFDDAKIQKAAEGLGVKILPKSLLSGLDFTVHSALLKPTNVDESSPEIVLIDDDALIRQMWTQCAQNQNLKLSVFRGVDEFLAAGVAPSASVFLDQHLGNGVLGSQEAWRLKEAGYAKIYLASSDETLGRVPEFIRAVRSKSFPKTAEL